MSLWLFPSPSVSRSSYSLEDRMDVLSLWSRVKRAIPSTLCLVNGQWEEYVYVWPGTRNPRNKYFFSETSGDGGCFNPMGSDQSAFITPTRLYLGGHVYIISDTLKNELVNLPPASQNSYIQTGVGYTNFIVAAPPGSVETGDEIILSGYDEVHGKPALV